VPFNYRQTLKPNTAILPACLGGTNRLFLFPILTLIITLIETVSFAQDLTPRPTQPPPFPKLSPSPPPETPLTLPPTPNYPESIPISGSLTVTQFVFEGNTAISNQELDNIPISFLEKNIGNVRDETLSFSQLIEIATLVANYYSQGNRTYFV
jgi:hypothetical protein